jgi:hypothetical protein
MTASRSATAPDVRRLEVAIESALQKRRGAERSLYRAQARLAQLDLHLHRLRAERDRLLTGFTAVLAAPSRVVRIGGLWSWAVACPFCGQEHLHGGDKTVPPQDGRRSHCHAPFRGGIYELVEVPE